MNFFSKIDFGTLSDTLQILYNFFDLCIFCCCKKALKIQFREKVYFTDTYYFCQLLRNNYKKNGKKSFFGLTFESLDQKFSKSGI